MNTPTTSHEPQPYASPFFSLPVTGSGRWAGWITLTAAASVIVANVFFSDSSGLYEVMRVSFVLIFMVSAIAALALTLRAIIVGRERSFVVWIALVICLPSTATTIAELTGLME